MIRKFYILFVLTLFIGLVSCEKEIIRPICDKGEQDTYFEDFDGDDNPGTTRIGETGEPGENHGTGGITDPDEDEDFDSDETSGITDPDEDEDYDDDGNGITDPDEDEDYDDEEDNDSGK